jgi:thiamine biosynthesis lipoprotein
MVATLAGLRNGPPPGPTPDTTRANVCGQGVSSAAHAGPIVTRAQTRAMSCTVTIVVTVDGRSDADGAHLVRTAATRLNEIESRWSRFLPSSEITALNEARGDPLYVSDDTVRLIESAVRAWHATSGAFDPTLLGTIVGLGYAASRDSAAMTTSLAPGTHPQGRPAEILVDRSCGVVRLPAGTTIDPGGIGKGLAADLVVDELIAGGAGGALVEIGGDIRMRGLPPAGTAWPIAIADSDDVVDIADGGIATSTPLRRTWIHDGHRRHHLIDPGTLRPSTADIVACTVIAGSSAWAEAFTKLPFVVGIDAAIDRYESLGLAGSITTSSGITSTSNWTEYRR